MIPGLRCAWTEEENSQFDLCIQQPAWTFTPPPPGTELLARSCWSEAGVRCMQLDMRLALVLVLERRAFLLYDGFREACLNGSATALIAQLIAGLRLPRFFFDRRSGSVDCCSAMGSKAAIEQPALLKVLIDEAKRNGATLAFVDWLWPERASTAAMLGLTHALFSKKFESAQLFVDEGLPFALVAPSSAQAEAQDAVRQATTWLLSLCRRDAALEAAEPEPQQRQLARTAAREAKRAAIEAREAEEVAIGGSTAAPPTEEALFTKEARLEALTLFNGYPPMAFAFLWGKHRLDLRFPEQLPEWAEHFSEQEAYKFISDMRTEVILRDFESRRLLARLKQEEQELQSIATVARPSGARLLIFVCNPYSEERDMHLPHAVDDALAANQQVAAKIIGGNAARPKAGAREAAQEDRDCTFKKLKSELTLTSEPRPWGFLFAGHSDSGTLRFTQADGKLEEPTSLEELASALCTSPPLELLFLNACNSATIVPRLQAVTGVKHIVAWSTAVNDAAAYLFARGFFRACAEQQRSIGQSGTLDYTHAFAAAKTAVTEQTRPVRLEGGGEQQLPYFGFGDPEIRTKLEGGSWAAGIPELNGMR